MKHFLLDGIAQTYSNLSDWQKNINFRKQSSTIYREILSDETFAKIGKSQILGVKNVEAVAYAYLGGIIDTFLGNKEESLNIYFLLSKSIVHYTKKPRFQNISLK